MEHSVSTLKTNTIQAATGTTVSVTSGHSLKTNTLTGTTTAGSILVTGEGNSTTTNLQQGLCKAWATLDGSGTIAFRDSFNQSAATDNGTGDYTFNFNNDFSDRNRCVNYTINNDEGTGRPYVATEIGTPAAGTSRVDNSVSNSPGDTDCEDCYLIAFGDLA